MFSYSVPSGSGGHIMFPAAILLCLTLLWQPSSSCPAPCECPTPYYVYCQDIRLEDADLPSLLSSLSPDILLLDLTGNRIYALQPDMFQNFPHLEYISLSANRISSLGDDVFKGLSNLKELDLDGNVIANISTDSFVGLSKLKTLRVSNNRLRSIPDGVMEALTSLTKLYLDHNVIATLSSRSFEGLSHVKYLNMSHNSLQSIHSFWLSHFTSIQDLDISHNYLTEISPEAFGGSVTSLQRIHLQHNSLHNTVFLTYTDIYQSLQSINISNNVIESIPSNVFPNLKRLKVLDLSSNHINRIASRSFHSVKLDALLLKNNRFSVINTKMFKSARHISTLDLSYNQISDIETGSFDSFRDTTVDLDVAHNKLPLLHPGMFRNMGKLRYFNLKSNEISRIEPGSLKGLENLLELDLTGNHLETLHGDVLTGPTHLRKLSLVCNPLRDLQGFRFESSNDNLDIVMNSTMTSSSSDTAVVTWPFSSGSQLYWKVTVTCLTPDLCGHAPFDATPSGYAPENHFSLEPYKDRVTLTHLDPGSDYFVCVRPVFVSPDVDVSQCVHVSTPEVTVTSSVRQIRTAVEELEQVNSGSSRNSYGSFLLFMFMYVIRLLLPYSV